MIQSPVSWWMPSQHNACRPLGEAARPCWRETQHLVTFAVQPSQQGELLRIVPAGR